MEENVRGCLTVNELKDFLCISRATAYSLIHRKGFPTLRIGRKVLIPISALQEWIQNQTEGVAE